MLRHLIIEGCDGAGKDTLIGRIFSTRWGGEKFKLHDRASRSDSGPMGELSQWVEDDLSVMDDPEQGPFIYNRHPLISEYIYADLREVNPGLAARFEDPFWREIQTNQVAAHCLLIIVQPDFRVIEENIRKQKASDQMPGVIANLREIYQRYQDIKWPGTLIRYDRFNDNMPNLIMKMKIALGEKNRD